MVQNPARVNYWTVIYVATECKERNHPIFDQTIPLHTINQKKNRSQNLVRLLCFNTSIRTTSSLHTYSTQLVHMWIVWHTCTCMFITCKTKLSVHQYRHVHICRLSESYKCSALTVSGPSIAFTGSGFILEFWVQPCMKNMTSLIKQ